MLEIDTFAADLFEEAKRFLEKAKEANDTQGKKAYLHATLLLGVSALEAHVNAIACEMLERGELDILERSILSEREYIFDKGSFDLINKLKMYNLIDRIEFLVRRFSDTRIDVNAEWWGKLHEGIGMRNSLVHPKNEQDITPKQVELAFEGILGVLDAMYMALYKTHFPALGRQFDSKMSF